MTTTKTVRQTVNALVGTYKKEIQEAAGNNVLTPGEQKKLSPFAQRHIKELRAETDTVTVGKAVAHLKPVIERAALAIAGDDGKIDAADVRKLRVTELRTRAATLFDGEGGTTGRVDLAKAVKAADVPILSDYGKSFGLEQHPAGASIQDIIGAITDMDVADFELDDWATLTNGAAAVKDFGLAMKDAAESRAEGADSDAEAKTITRAYEGVAKGAKAFFNGDDFRKFVLAQHSIAEDGDVEYHILLAQKRDGSWTSLTYSDFPF